MNLANFPKLILHFDVNQTLINKDKARGFTNVEVAANQVAKDTIGKWTHHPLWKKEHEAMSWRDFIEKVIVPGDRVTKEMADKRKKLISSIPIVVQKYPQIKDQVLSTYQEYLEASTDSVFDSFFHLVEKMKEKSLEFVVVLRTFGDDLKTTAEEIEKNSSLKFKFWGRFQKGCLHLEGEETKTFKKTQEIFRTFAEATSHFAVQDSYQEWNENERHFSHGKHFIFEQGEKTLSLFFDDNIKGKPDQDIICPTTSDGEIISPDKLVNQTIFKVHTGLAMKDQCYFVDLVNKALRSNGFDCLNK